MTRAEHMMRVFNPNALCGCDPADGEWFMIEDIRVPDDHSGDDLIFRVEYRSDHEGENARAWLLHNPVHPITDDDYHQTHLSSGGFICFGHGITANGSPYDLAFAIPRIRLWAAGYLLGQREGFEAVCGVIPGWRGSDND